MIALGVTGAEVELALFPLITGLLGGLALFLFGMEQMATALKAVAGDRMKVVLSKLTANRVLGALTGAFVTAVIQSSSVTTVLVVGFISAGLMSLAQSVGVIMGANVGTTVTAQIIAFKVTKYALLMIAIGFALAFFSKRDSLQTHGKGIMGLGLVFFGMVVMSEAMSPLRTHEPFRNWILAVEEPALGILVGTALTALIQSSSATSGVVIVLASKGFITLEAGIAISFGANIGTCVTALLAAVGKPREALRAAVVHVLFNVIGVLIWLPFITQLAELVTWFSPTAAGLTGDAKLAAEAPRQIANAHTTFNLANTLLLLPLSAQLARLVEWLVPDRPLEEEGFVRAKYLDTELLATPSLALDRARLEILHMGDRVGDMLKAILPALLHGTRQSLATVCRMDDAVDTLHGHIVTYLGKISRKALSEAQTGELVRLMEATNSLENIGDIIETNLVRLGEERIESALTISPETSAVITEFHNTVVKALDTALLAVTQKNAEAAELVISMKAEINRQASSAALHEAKRLVAEEPKRLPAYTIETDVLENLKRIYYFSKRIARTTAGPAAAREAT